VISVGDYYADNTVLVWSFAVWWTQSESLMILILNAIRQEDSKFPFLFRYSPARSSLFVSSLHSHRSIAK